MPDGSYYDLAGSVTGQTRKAIKFTDRNGNFTTYNESNGTWTDTLGRTLSQPFGLSAPTTPTVLTYTMPGMAGNYKFYWKKLKDTTAAESGLSNFNLSLKYPADNANFAPRAAGTYLFQSDTAPVNKRYVSDNGQLFNPIVLTAIELPTGQKYEFRYNVFGIIEEIDYPTGGAETFLPLWGLPSLSDSNDFFYSQTNSGVIQRKVYETRGQGTPYTWTYNVGSVAPNGYKVIINNPDGTIQERFLHRGNPSCNGLCPGNYGYDNILAGYAYEERGYNSAGQIVSRKLTSWTKTVYPIPYTSYTMDIHPRVNQEESIIFDTSGNGVSATTKYEYEGNLNLRETPVLVNKTLQYAFVPLPSGSTTLPPPGDDPDDDPTPVPTPIPPTLLRTQETTYLINDANISSTIKDAYKNQNMIGLATVAKVKDETGTTLSQSELKYDEAGYPLINQGTTTNWIAPQTSYRANLTTTRTWVQETNSWI